ncbi:FimB/Mfa2 family fimbrial subunit [Sphingobacterium spiritivorum]|uniref:FimB/Mfa2 family fimbrial subunit n=1 Tax=Sphingobacterium spiritivorum TaxID=258 RepID=UPI003DA32067
MERIRLPILLMMCMFTLTLISCIKEKPIIDDTLPDPGNTTEVTFAVSMPGLSQNISTYAISDNEENKVSTVDVLVFEVVNANTENFVYRMRGRNIRPLTANSIQFQVTMQTHATKLYRFVVIANARTEVDAMNYPTSGTDALKANILSKLIFSNTGIWNTSSPTDYRVFPMWGESPNPYTVNTNLGTISLNLLRSLARVDVNVEPTLASVFRMTSISVYNSNANGRIAPIAGNYSVNDMKVTAPSMPSSIQINSTPLVYNSPDWLKFEKEIYLFEKAAATSANASNAISLIIGGRYDGGAETFYKLEFLSATATPAPLPVLRNHKYVFNITNVSGDGYPTKAAALSSKPSNMQATITTINLSDMPIVYFDEHYYLALETDLVNYITDQAGGQFYKLKTDFPGGWTWTSDQPSWLSMNPYNDGANIIVLINPGTPATPRHGTLTITAGKIRARIKVYQGYGSNPLPNIP